MMACRKLYILLTLMINPLWLLGGPWHYWGPNLCLSCLLDGPTAVNGAWVKQLLLADC